MSVDHKTNKWLYFRKRLLNSFLVSGDFCRLLIAFANSLDPDQDPLIVSPDLDSNCLIDSLKEFLKECSEKVNFEKSQQTTTKA